MYRKGSEGWKSVTIFARENENCRKTRKLGEGVFTSVNKEDLNHLYGLSLKIFA